MKRYGFTLVELLAVIVILAVILAIAIPSISNVLISSKKNSFESSVRMILKSVDTRKSINIDFNTSTLTVDNMPTELEIDNSNFSFLEIESVDSETYISVTGKNKWDNFSAFGTKNNLIVSNTSTGALPTAEECFTFDLVSGIITDYLTSNPICTANVIIPPTIGGVAVRTLGVESFCDKGLASVIIPSTVILIGRDALSWNDNLTSIIIPNSVTSIGEMAFAGTSLASVIIPNSVTTIGTYAFAWTDSLTNVTMSRGVQSIGDYAFEGNVLNSITIPNTVTSIGDWAFANNVITSLTIPSSVVSIGEAAFNNNMLLDAQAFIYGRNANGSENNTVLASYGGAKKSGVVIPNSVTTIGNYAFDSTNLISVTLPTSLTTIGSSAFNSNKLTSITIPSTVNLIDTGAFMNNTLTSITMGKAGTTLNSIAFCNVNNNFRTTYTAGGAGTYIGTQCGAMVKQ